MTSALHRMTGRLPSRSCWASVAQTCRRLSRDMMERLIAEGDVERLRRAVTGRLLDIPIARLTSEYAFSLAPQGWNYIRALVAECAEVADRQLDQTTFFQFFQHEKVQTIRDLNDALFLHDPVRRQDREAFRFYFGTYPWGHWTQSGCARGGKPWGHHYDRMTGAMTRDMVGYRRNPWYQPGDPYPLAIEYEQTRSLYHSLTQSYAPIWHGTFPTVILMVRCNGDWRAVRDNGHHRLAILSYLGRESVSAMAPKNSVGVVHEAEVEQWHYVKAGLCPAVQAQAIFDAYFELNGRERIDFLGLPSVY